MVKKAPEVVVKVSGYGYGKGIRASMRYISRNGGVAMETSDGQHLTSAQDVEAVAQQWRDHAGDQGKRQRDSVNIVLSMPPGTDPKAVATATRLFVARNCAGHDTVWAQHHDERHPHTHVMVALLPKDRGPKLNPRKDTLQAWRESFAVALREQGVACAATPRRARGVTQKSDRQPLRHMRAAGRTPRVDHAQRREALGALVASPAARPWEQAAVQRQQTIRQQYAAAAATVARSRDEADRELAASIAAFVSTMPPVKFRRQVLQHQIRVEAAAQQRGGDLSR